MAGSAGNVGRATAAGGAVGSPLGAYSEAESERSVDALLRRLARAGRFRDEETAEHVERVARSSALIARQLGWSQVSCTKVRTATALHDLGKIGVPDAVLRKPGPLSPPERALIERHPEIGHEILAGPGDWVFELAANVALTHHERVDGSGYPRGLSGSSIPVEGRITAVADVFDALTHDRPYRPAFEPDKALEMLRQGRGSQFDATILEAFESVISEILDTSHRYPDSWEVARPRPHAAPEQPLRVLVVENHQAIAKGLTLLLRSEGIEIAGSAENLARARQLIARRRPDVAIVDMDLAGESGLDLLPAARAQGTRVLLYDDDPTPAVAREARAAGAGGLASKASTSRELLDAVGRVSRGEWSTDPCIAQHVPAAGAAAGLTPREREVATLLASGLTGAQIAAQLFVSDETVRTHVKNAMRRIGANTRAHLVALAAARNAIELPDRRCRREWAASPEAST
jgi:response regulator RpfG family c-di-GMP phosphodiesterase/DNA-binding CsgD family transcriptional regulator